jgi:hypothetical protein
MLKLSMFWAIVTARLKPTPHQLATANNARVDKLSRLMVVKSLH